MHRSNFAYRYRAGAAPLMVMVPPGIGALLAPTGFISREVCSHSAAILCSCLLFFFYYFFHSASIFLLLFLTTSKTVKSLQHPALTFTHPPHHCFVPAAPPGDNSSPFFVPLKKQFLLVNTSSSAFQLWQHPVAKQQTASPNTKSRCRGEKSLLRTL